MKGKAKAFKIDMITVKDVSDFIDEIAPYKTQCSWDNCGILIGNPEAKIKKIGLCLDLTEETLENAKKNGADLIITHHPAIFSGQKSFLSDNLIYKTAMSSIAVISAHTCFDCADGGVNDILCEILGLSDVKPVSSEELSAPMVRMGKTEKEYTPEELAKLVSEKLHTTVRLVDGKDKISSVAVCGGAGMDFLFDAIKSGAGAYITGEIKHHEMLLAKEKGITVISAGHFETEYPAMNKLKDILAKKFKELDFVLVEQSNPVKYIG